MKRHMRNIALAAAISSSSIWSLEASAETFITVPNANETLEGDAAANCFPFGCGDRPSVRYQQIYVASEFGGTRGVIDKIAFRLDQSQRPFSLSGIDIEVRLSHTDTSPDKISGTFANNITEPQTLVLDVGSLSLSSTATRTPFGPFEFDIVLDVDDDDVFIYKGINNLLLDIKIFKKPFEPLVFVGFDPVTARSISSRAVADRVDATTATGFGVVALVTQFSVTTTIEVAIGIKPGSDPNSINLNSAGVIPVAILSTDTFDVTTEADPDKLALAGAAIRRVGKGDKRLCYYEDVNDDGLFDLGCQFETAQFMNEPPRRKQRGISVVIPA